MLPAKETTGLGLRMNYRLQGRPCLPGPDAAPPQLWPPQRYLLGNEQLCQVQVATGGRSMQGCPAFAVAGIDLGPSVQELLHHLPEVIDAALGSTRPECQSPGQCPFPSHPTLSVADLVQGRQAVLIGQVRADPALEELADCEKGGRKHGQDAGLGVLPS